MELAIIFAVILLLILAFLATVDLAFSHISDVSLRRIASEADDHKPEAHEFLRQILDNRPLFRFSISAAIQFVLVSLTVLIVLVVKPFTESDLFLLLITLLIALSATLIVRQIVPRFIIRNPEQTLLWLLPIVRPLYLTTSFIARPFIGHLGTAKDAAKIDASMAPDSAEERAEDSSEDLHALMEVGEAEGIIEEKERELIESMVEFSETRAGAIMTPRTEICALPIDSSIIAARDLIIAQKYSRLPVYRDNIDNIEGVIYVRDLLQAWAEGRGDESISMLVRDPYFVPDTNSASELLKNMQLDHVQLAIVIDEYGGVAGIVTVEDIIEEIVGEIEDEDEEGEEIIEIIEGEDGYYDVLGSTDIDKIERLFDIDIDDDDFTTVAGFVTSRAGYVPKVGEILQIDDLDIEILRSDEKKIYLVRLRRPVEESELAPEIDQ